jgi:undecaprenyl-diphosphatase
MDILSFIVQGITEFLPISSTAHLHICSKLMGTCQLAPAQTMALNLVPGIVFLLYFYREVIRLLVGFLRVCVKLLTRRKDQRTDTKGHNEDDSEEFFKFFFWSTLPMLIVGMVLSLLDVKIPGSVKLIGANSIIFGVLLGLADIFGTKQGVQVTGRKGKVLGIAHVLAYLPGVSRLGICLTITRAMGLSREDAMSASFVCGIPALLGAGLVGVLKLGVVKAPMLIMFPLGVGTLFLFRRYVRKHGLLAFAVYRIALGVMLVLM